MKYREIYEIVDDGSGYVEPDYRAGLIPYYREGSDIKICLMIPSDSRYGGSDPQIAKGGVEKGMDNKETAIKEGEEELGYKHKSKYKVNLLWDNKKMRMAYYFVEVDNMKFGKPHYETKEVLWVDINEAENIIRSWQKVVVRLLKRRLGV